MPIGIDVLWSGFVIHFLKLGFLSSGTYGYNHLLTQRTHLSEFNMEKQGNMIADYFIGKELDLENILPLFEENPKNQGLLPSTTAVWD